jgi:hypothetical protein
MALPALLYSKALISWGRILFRATQSGQLSGVDKARFTYIIPVFRTYDILRRIRMLGSVHWITDPDPGPALFVSDFQETNQKLVFLLII